MQFGRPTITGCRVIFYLLSKNVIKYILLYTIVRHSGAVLSAFGGTFAFCGIFASAGIFVSSGIFVFGGTVFVLGIFAYGGIVSLSDILFLCDSLFVAGGIVFDFDHLRQTSTTYINFFLNMQSAFSKCYSYALPYSKKAHAILEI